VTRRASKNLTQAMPRGSYMEDSWQTWKICGLTKPESSSCQPSHLSNISAGVGKWTD